MPYRNICYVMDICVHSSVYLMIWHLALLSELTSGRERFDDFVGCGVGSARMQTGYLVNTR